MSCDIRHNRIKLDSDKINCLHAYAFRLVFRAFAARLFFFLCIKHLLKTKFMASKIGKVAISVCAGQTNIRRTEIDKEIKHTQPAAIAIELNLF